MSLYKIPFEDLLEAYYSSRKHKRNTISQLKFEINLEENLSILLRDLRIGSYVVGSSVCFMIEDPVKREIFAADFRDRIVHHLIYNYISPIFEKHFIYDSYSCRLGKGTLFGIKRLDHHIRSCSDNYKKSTYVLKLDIEGYFMNINRDLLYQKVRKVLDTQAVVSFDREFVNTTIRDIAYNEPILNCRIKGRLSDIKPRCITIDKRTRKKIFLFYEVAEKLKSKHVASGRELVESYRATINSYMGILGHYKSYNLKKRLICNY